MDEAGVAAIEDESSSAPGAPLRLLIKGAVLGAAGLLIGFRAGGWAAALGALGGCAVAALYAWGYIHSHLRRAVRDRIVDPWLVRSTGFRILALAVVSAGVWLAGRSTFVAYLLAFAAGFALILATEAPRVMRALRSQGLTGGSG